MTAALRALTHDHRDLTALLHAVRSAVTRVERAPSTLDDELHEIRDGVEALREALLEHFAREQEGLLPFVRERAPAMRARGDALFHEHDVIAERLSELVFSVDALGTHTGLASFRAILASFEDIYASHTRAEHAFLADVDTLVAHDPKAADELRALLDEP